MINNVTKIYDELTNTLDCYKITYENSNIVKYVPLNEENSDYQAIQEWVENGGVIIDNGA